MHRSLMPSNCLGLLLLLALWSSSLIHAQESLDSGSQPATTVTPQEVGLEPYTLQRNGRAIDFYLSTDGKPVDKNRRLPLIVFLQGSGATPIYFGLRPRLSSTLMVDSGDFPNHHYAVLSKPGVPFYSKHQTVTSEVYDQYTSLEYRVDAVNAVIEHLIQQPWVDASQIILIGHSEGSDVGPWAAVKSPHVTHLVVLCPGALSQMMDFVIMERKKVARGQQTEQQATEILQSNRDAYRRIFQDPDNWKEKWYGHSYLRWSTFLRPALDAYMQLEIPILAIAGRDDENTPCESAEALQLEYLRAGRTNLTFEMWPVDHYFLQDEEQGTKRDRRPDAILRINEWLKANPIASSSH